MMKKINSLAVNFALLLMAANVAAGMPEETLMDKLDAKRILGVLPKGSDDKNFPFIVRYIKSSDPAPSCSLIINASPGGVVELVSPEPGGDLPACGPRLSKPINFTQGGRYLIYEYQIEDPRKEITAAFQLLKASPENIRICKNDQQLTAIAMNVGPSRARIKQAFRLAVKKLGCE